MYSVFAILKVHDRYDLVDPEVEVIETSNCKNTLINKLHDCYKEYLEELKESYSEEERKEEWYQEMLEQITWDGSDSFSDTSGYKEFTKYTIVEL